MEMIERKRILEQTRGSHPVMKAPGNNWAAVDLSKHNPRSTPEEHSGYILEKTGNYKAAFGWGGYGEDRSVYASHALFRDDENARCIHLGIDLWGPSFEPVYTPVDGVIHSFQDNDNPGDYGPTIILEHQHPEGFEYFTLHGHLSRASLVDLTFGQALKAGEKVGELGPPEENGGWEPHVHFQVILDMNGQRGDYPGVASRSEAESYLSGCPDPHALAGIA